MVTRLRKACDDAPKRRTRTRAESAPEERAQVREGEVVELPASWCPDGPAIELLRSAKPIRDNHRDDGYLHVSDVISKCLRKIALSVKNNTGHPSVRVFDGVAITYAIGTALHDFVKARFAASYDDMVWAEWHCPCEKTLVGPCVRATAVRERNTCPSCGLLPTIQKEHTIVDPEWILGGSPDLVFHVDSVKAKYVIEIKSISASQWAELTRPKPDHVIQVLFYWLLLRRAGYRVVDRVSILYVTKEWTMKLPYKEYVIFPEKAMQRLDPYIEDIERYVASVKSSRPDNLPPRIACSSPSAPEAKKCHMCTLCFSLD